MATVVLDDIAAHEHALNGDIAMQMVVLLHGRARAAGLHSGGLFNLGEPDDFRIPDLGFHRTRDYRDYMPTAALVVEVLSPCDETFKKFGFYAVHAVDEVWLAAIGIDGYEPDASQAGGGPAQGAAVSSGAEGGRDQRVQVDAGLDGERVQREPTHVQGLVAERGQRAVAGLHEVADVEVLLGATRRGMPVQVHRYGRDQLQVRNARLLDGLAQRAGGQGGVAVLQVAAGLQPQPDLAVQHQQDVGTRDVQHDGAGRQVVRVVAAAHRPLVEPVQQFPA